MKPYYQDAYATIYHGDCREILPMLPKVDLVLTDPPYGIDYDSRGGGGSKDSRSLAKKTVFEIPTVAGDEIEFDPTFLFKFGARQMIWGAHYFYQNLPAKGRLLIWKKRETSPGKHMDFADAEVCFDSKRGLLRVISHTHNGFVRDLGDMEKPVHPTQKPLDVITWCLQFAPDAQTILDPFMGSGTTLVAAKQLGRKSIGIELEEKYCEVAARRLSQEYIQFTDEPEKPIQQEALLIEVPTTTQRSV